LLQVVSEHHLGASMANDTRLNQLVERVATLKKTAEQHEQKFVAVAAQQKQDLDALEFWLDKKFDIILAQIQDFVESKEKSLHPAEPIHINKDVDKIHQWEEQSGYNKGRGQQFQTKRNWIPTYRESRCRRFCQEDNNVWRKNQENNYAEQQSHEVNNGWGHHQEDSSAWISH